MGNQYSYQGEGEEVESSSAEFLAAVPVQQGGAAPLPVPTQARTIPVPGTRDPSETGSAPEQSAEYMPVSQPRTGTIHTRTQSFDAGDSASPVYKLARLSLRQDEDDDRRGGGLDTIGDSPRSDTSSGTGFPSDAEIAAVAELDVPPPVPTVINWRHPGLSVFLTGDFNGWRMDSPMQVRGNILGHARNNM